MAPPWRSRRRAYNHLVVFLHPCILLLLLLLDYPIQTIAVLAQSGITASSEGTVGFTYGDTTTTPSPEQTVAESKAQYLIASFWDWHLREFPEFATEAEVHDYDDKVTEYTEDAFQRRVRNASHFLSSIHQLRGEVSSMTRNSLIIMEDSLNTFMEGFEFRFQTVYLPCQSGTSYIKDWELTLAHQQLTSAQDFEKLLTRYEAIPHQIQQMMNLTQDAMKRGYLRSALGLGYTMNDLRNQLATTEDSIFYKPFNTIPDAIPENTRRNIKQRAVKLIVEGIIPMLWKYYFFMTKKYLPAAQSVPIGVYALPDGRDLYRHFLNYHLSARMTPDQVHQLGLAEVEKVRTKIHKIAHELGLKDASVKPSTGDIIRNLLHKPHLYFNDSDSMVKAYHTMSKEIHKKLGSVLSRVPNVPYKIEPTFSGPEGTYHDPTNSSGGAGVFYANVGSPHGPSTNIIPLLLHELEPGHHTQASYLRTSSDPLPVFRRKLDFTNAFAVPFHFPLYTAYAEGWALYAEMLGEEMGLFEEPLNRLGRYSNEMLRACRLVVDTGIHAYGWPRWTAEDYLINNTGLSAEKAAFEVDRYVARPGQACAYKIGERRILEIRRRAEMDLGSYFDLGEFHDRLLSLGPAPLHLVEVVMYSWVSEMKTKYNIKDIEFRYGNAYTISAAGMSHYSCQYECISLFVFILSLYRRTS